MSVLSISLPSDLLEWVEQEAAASGASVDDFFNSLTREARARKQQERTAQEAELEALLLEGLNSGDPQPLDAQWWATVRTEVDARLKQPNNGARG